MLDRYGRDLSPEAPLTSTGVATKSYRLEIATQILAGLALLCALQLGLLASLLAGLLIYELVHVLAPQLSTLVTKRTGKILVVAGLATIVIVLIGAGILWLVSFLSGGSESLAILLQRMAEVIETARPHLPLWAGSYVPADAVELKAAASVWLREHAGQMRLIGEDVWRTLAHIVIGMIIGGMIAVSREAGEIETGPLVRVLTDRARFLGAAFRSVVFAQVRISALNTVLTSLYLLALVPLLDVNLKLGVELLALGDTRNDRVLQVDGHKTLLNARYKLGKFVEAQEHFERGMRFYEEDPWPAALLEQFDDPGPHLLVIGGCALWVRGYPDRARRAVADAIARGHRGGHHLSAAHAVHLSGHLAELMDDWDGVRKANETTMALATEWGLSGLRHQVSLRERLVAVAVHDDPEQMEYKRRHPQPGFARPLHDGVLARAYGRRGAPEESLQVIEESLAWAEETGSQFFDAELHRLRAGLLLRMQRTDKAEFSYRKALEVARGQGAWLWALRAACDLARMLRDQGRQAHAHDLLAPIHSWFTEGFDVIDLQRAKALLEDLSRRVPSIR